MNGLALAAAIIASLALALSGLLASLEWRRYRLPLILRHTDTQQFAFNHVSALFLVRVSLVNMASVGRTVFDFGFDEPDGYQVFQIPGVYDFSKGAVAYRPTKVSGVEGIDLPAPDTIEQPLDIAPHKSESRWFAVEVVPVPPSTLGFGEIRIPLKARDVNGNEIARTDATLKQEDGESA